MALYLSSETIKNAVSNLKSAGTNSRLFAYLILRRFMVTNADESTGTIVLTGANCKPVTDEAALIGCGDNRYFNPLDANGASEGFLGERWWSNGPTDNINRWSTRSNMLERIKDVSPITIRVNEYDSATVPSFLQIRDDNRIDVTDIAIWWFRNEDIEYLVEDGAIACSTLRNEFCKRLQLSDSECTDLFARSPESRVDGALDISAAVAIPKEYLPYPDASTSEDSNDEDNLSLFDDNSDESPTPKIDSQPRNLIFFGAPGTGKSYELSKLAVGVGGEPGCFNKSNVTRVTFHPDYTYAQFVGCFKPFIEPEIDEESPVSAIKYAPGRIEYKFVPGPFINTYVAAIRHPDQNYLLIIEEINRANPAAVFGDVFQLLDRKEDGTSEYSVVTSEDLRWYMFKQWKSYLNGIKPEERNGILYSLDDPEAEKLASSISLPSNMYIWATMNSADQGVFPMDTAFKRRWDFRYMGINDGSSELDGVVVPVGTPARMVRWDALRRGINKVLLDAGVNEDKLLGPFFISPSRLRDISHFTQTFMDKVLLYLFEDAAKNKKSKVFSIEGNPTYSAICEDFRARGELAFNGMKELASVDGGQSKEAVEPDGADGEA